MFMFNKTKSILKAISRSFSTFLNVYIFKIKYNGLCFSLENTMQS